MADTAFTVLDNEWEWLRRSPELAVRLRKWAVEHPALARFNSIRELAEFATIATRPEWDAVMAAVGSASVTDGVAARVVLQLLTPGLKAGAHRLRRLRHFDDAEEVASVVVATAWARIRSYRWDRRRRFVAENLVRQTIRDVAVGAVRAERRTCPVVHVEVPDGPDEPSLTPDIELLDVVVDAVEAKWLSPSDASLIIRARILGVPTADLGEPGELPQTVRRRLLRAERVLAEVAFSQPPRDEQA